MALAWACPADGRMVSLPEALREFVVAFDGCLYPELIDESIKGGGCQCDLCIGGQVYLTTEMVPA